MRATGRRMGVPTVRRYELLAPPGFDGRQELKRVMTWLGWAVVIMLAWFLLAYWSELSTVRSYRENGTPIGMRPYAEVAAFAYLPFVPVFAGFVYLLLRNWNYFRSGSKSFYTMRRLKNRWEYPARCALLPLCGMAALWLSAQLMTLLCGWIYVRFTPEAWLPAGAWDQILRLLLGGLLR